MLIVRWPLLTTLPNLHGAILVVDQRQTVSSQGIFLRDSPNFTPDRVKNRYESVADDLP